jgi:excisionase family DNA binding protein
MRVKSDVLTVPEVAEYLHLSPSTIYKLLKRREIPAFKIGSDWRFNISHIDKWRMRNDVGSG